MRKLIAVVTSVLIAASSLPVAAADAPAPATAPASDQIVARVNGSPITMTALQRPLVEGYGLNVLLRLVQLELARQYAAKSNITISQADIQRERDMTVDKMFQDSNAKLQDQIDKAKEKHDAAEAARLTDEMKRDNERAFQQFLESQHQSEADFNLVIETNVYLRRIAEPILAGKITEDNLKEAFATLYGETIECRHIQCATLQEIQRAGQRLKDGEPFERVAREMSRNQATASNGGRLPAFSRQMQGLPQAFKDAAFALKPGEVSDIVQAEGAFHLIILDKRNAPKVVKFEDVKESIRADLYERAVQATIRQLRQQIQDQALGVLQIEEPTLKRQLEARIAQRKTEIKDRDEIRRQLDKEHELQRDNNNSAPILPLPPAPSAAAPATLPVAEP